MARHAIQPDRLLLFCSRCHSQHEDLGVWATTRTHKTHLCHFCGCLFRPQVATSVGVALAPDSRAELPALLLPLAVFERLPEYSYSIPTGPREAFIWRRRAPYDAPPLEADWYLAETVAMPDDPPGEISIVWRRLHVAEWLAADVLRALLGGKAAA